MDKTLFIYITGNIGVGKSTLTQNLFNELNKTDLKIDIMRENFDDNLYLKKYYQ